jgi:type III secretion protein T
MDAFSAFGSLSDLALLLGLSTTRVAVAFLLVPLFTAELIPALVRNAMFLAIAMLSLLLQPSITPMTLTGQQWISMFGKEAFIGGAIGILFARSRRPGRSSTPKSVPRRRRSWTRCPDIRPH